MNLLATQRHIKTRFILFFVLTYICKIKILLLQSFSEKKISLSDGVKAARMVLVHSV